MEEVSTDSDAITVDSNDNTETRERRCVTNVEIEIGGTQCVKKLTVQHMNAVRWIRKTKFTIAVRKFQQSRKPYDVRDIMEQYSEGHSEVMVRIKELHRRMDHVLGKPLSNLQDFHEKHTAKPATMQTRLCHIEQQLHLMEKTIQSQNTMLEEIFIKIGKRKKVRHTVSRKTSSFTQVTELERL